MVRWFAEQSGGTVEIVSEINEGTTVTLLLPASITQVAESNEGTMPLSTLPSGTEKILVLAMDEAVRATIRQVLEVLGYTVEFATVADNVTTQLSTGRFHVLIADEAVADDELLRGIAREVSVIVAATGRGTQQRLSAQGVVTLLKPFSIADLAGTVRRVIDRATTE